MLARSIRVIATVIAVGIAAQVQSGHAQTNDKPIDVVVTLPSQSLSYAATWIAEDAGFYKKNGLNVTTRQMVGVAANNAVISGSADFLLGTAATALIGASKGQRMLMLANMVDRPSTEIVMRKDIAAKAGITDKSSVMDKLKALKGKTVAVGGLGNATHAWQRLASRAAGLDPETDMVVTPIDPVAMVGAMSANRIEAFSATPPFTTEAIVKLGAVLLASAATNDVPGYLPTASTVLMTLPGKCEKEREKCLRMVHSYQDAANFIHDHPVETWEIIKKRNDKMDPAVLAGAWAAVSKAYTTDLSVTTQALTNAQKFSLDAGLLEPADTIKSFDGLFSDAFLK